MRTMSENEAKTKYVSSSLTLFLTEFTLLTVARWLNQKKRKRIENSREVHKHGKKNESAEEVDGHAKGSNSATAHAKEAIFSSDESYNRGG